MAEMQRTELPGVGERRDFVTEQGERLGVVVHRDGNRELFVYRRDDPDSCAFVARLSEQDARRLVTMLGN